MRRRAENQPRIKEVQHGHQGLTMRIFIMLVCFGVGCALLWAAKRGSRSWMLDLIGGMFGALLFAIGLTIFVMLIRNM